MSLIRFKSQQRFQSQLSNYWLQKLGWSSNFGLINDIGLVWLISWNDQTLVAVLSPRASIVATEDKLCGLWSCSDDIAFCQVYSILFSGAEIVAASICWTLAAWSSSSVINASSQIFLSDVGGVQTLKPRSFAAAVGAFCQSLRIFCLALRVDRSFWRIMWTAEGQQQRSTKPKEICQKKKKKKKTSSNFWPPSKIWKRRSLEGLPGEELLVRRAAEPTVVDSPTGTCQVHSRELERPSTLAYRSYCLLGIFSLAVRHWALHRSAVLCKEVLAASLCDL